MKGLINTFILAAMALLSSCLSTKNTHRSINESNFRTEVSGAGFNKKTNTIGITATVASAAAGGYIGYQSNLLTYYENGAPKTNQIGNAVIGAVTGMGISMLVNNLQKNGQKWGVSSLKEQTNWIEKSGNSNVILHTGTNLSSFTMMSRSEQARRNFSISNYQDFADYKKVFTTWGFLNSKYRESISRFSKKDLYLVHDDSFGLDAENIRLTKEAIYRQCSRLDDFLEVAVRIKDFRERAKADAWKRCKTISDYAYFSSTFTEQRDQAETAAFKLVGIRDINLIQEFRRYFPESMHHIEILQRSKAYLSYELVKEVAQVYELKDQTLRYKDENYVLVPQYHFAVITVDAPFSDVDISAQNTSNSGGATGKKKYLSLPIPMITSQKTIFIIYTSEEHEVLKFSITSRSTQSISFDVHFVEILSKDRTGDILFEEGGKLLINETARLLGFTDKYDWGKIAFNAIDLYNSGIREFTKNKIISLTADEIQKLLTKENSYFSKLSAEYFKKLAIDIAKNI